MPSVSKKKTDIHVIEKSAYDRLEKENTVLREALEEIDRTDHDCGIDVGVALQALDKAKRIREGE